MTGSDENSAPGSESVASSDPETYPGRDETYPGRGEEAEAEAEAEALAQAEPEPLPDSTSIGGPNNGSLRDAATLPDQGPGFERNRRQDRGARYGTRELVGSLMRAAAAVHEALPGSTLVINDLGLPEGGPIPHHGSHQAGRDVDVLFYLLDDEGEPTPSVGAFLDRRGVGYDFGDLSHARDDRRVHLDAPRTWRFLRAMIEDPEARLQRVFVAEHLRSLLLREARRSEAPAEVVARFEALTCQPRYPHDDHLHLRLYCTPEDLREGCADSPPIYPWRREALRAEELEEVMQTRAPRSRRAHIVTHEEARASAGALHPRVERWLQRREAWLQPPHPGRRWCR